MDSIATESNLTYGSRQLGIHFMVVDVVMKAREFGITMAARWMSREDPEMQLADSGSEVHSSQPRNSV